MNVKSLKTMPKHDTISNNHYSSTKQDDVFSLLELCAPYLKYQIIKVGWNTTADGTKWVARKATCKHFSTIQPSSARKTNKFSCQRFTNIMNIQVQMRSKSITSWQWLKKSKPHEALEFIRIASQSTYYSVDNYGRIMKLWVF